MFRSRGGGVSDFTPIEGRSQTSVFFRSPLDQKEAIGVVFRSMHPPQAILEPRRVRVTLIPGSTLGVVWRVGVNVRIMRKYRWGEGKCGACRWWCQDVKKKHSSFPFPPFLALIPCMYFYKWRTQTTCSSNLLFPSWLMTVDGVEHRNVL